MAAQPLIRLAVFGQPVAHSLSPRIHRLFADQCGLTVDYQAIEATSETFPQRLNALAADGGVGCNITAPLKGDAWRIARHSSDRAARARAANTLILQADGDWYADSTDGQGLIDDLESLRGHELQDSRICLLGAGGAAASVLEALLLAGPSRIVICNRTRQRATDLAGRFSDLGAIEVATPGETGDWGPYDLVVNATSLGHQGQTPELPEAWMAPGGLCYDMNYGAASEPLRLRCLDNGTAYSDGLGMLVGQAAVSFNLWTGRTPDASAVLARLRRAAR